MRVETSICYDNRAEFPTEQMNKTKRLFTFSFISKVSIDRKTQLKRFKLSSFTFFFNSSFHSEALSNWLRLTKILL